jgi:topoisomerase-4 subunit A
LAQIFVEEGIYKRIEKCKTYELIVKEVRTGLEKHRDEWLPIVKSLWESLELRGIDTTDKHAVARLEQLSKGQIPDSEVEKLLEIPIRRISLFDINKNREEMELLQQTLTRRIKT